MNYTNLIDSFQAHLFVKYALNINSFTRSDTGVVIDSEPQLSRTCKTSLLFAPLAVCVNTGCSAFPFYTPNKPLIQLYFKYKTVLIPKQKLFFLYFRYL